MSTAIFPKVSGSYTYLQLLFAPPAPPSLLAQAQPEHTLYSEASLQENVRQKKKKKRIPESTWQSKNLKPTFAILYPPAEGLLKSLTPFLQREGASVRTFCPPTHTWKKQVTEQTSTAFSKRYRLLKIAQFQLPPHPSLYTHRERRPWTQLDSTFLLPLTGDSVDNFRNSHQEDKKKRK